MLAWAGVTTAGFEHEVFPGGHFYLRSEPAPVLEALARRLTAPSRRPPPVSPVPAGARPAS